MDLYARDNPLHCALLDPSVEQEIHGTVLHIGEDYTRSAKRQGELSTIKLNLSEIRGSSLGRTRKVQKGNFDAANTK